MLCSRSGGCARVRQVVMLGLLLTLGWLSGAVWAQVPLGFDLPLMWTVRAWRSPGLDPLALTLDALGGIPVMGTLSVLLVVWLGWRRYLRAAAMLTLSMLGAVALTWLLKCFFDRPRPLLWPHGTVSFGDAFPSGHSVYAATLPVALALLVRSGPWQVPAWGVATLWMLAMGWSRVYLGVHFPSDVLAGWCLGLVWTLAVWQFIQFQPSVSR